MPRFARHILTIALLTLALPAWAEEEAIPKPKPVPQVPVEDIRAAIARGVDFLIEDQNPSGSWGSATRTKQLNIYAPFPGGHDTFRSATTALCIEALIDNHDGSQRVETALAKAEDWFIRELPTVKRAEFGFVGNVWSHAYGIQALVKMHARKPDDTDRQKKIADLIQNQVDMLERFEYVGGGWGYYDFDHHTQKPGGTPTSFTTASVLFALHAAREFGAEVPQKIIDRGIATVNRQRKPDNTYLYSSSFQFYTMRGINRPAGSLGRSQACNAALRLWGDESISDQVVVDWLDRFFARLGWLDIGRKRPIPHEAHFQIAGYFYYYGQYHAAISMAMLPKDQQPVYQNHMAHSLLPLQEKDGSWWDYPLYDYHQPYGTSYTLMALKRCLPHTD
jgi:hypothetical protein